MRPDVGEHVEQCDHCGQPVLVRGTREPHYTHAHGSVFCMTTTAQVDGRDMPDSGSTVDGPDA